MTFDTDAKNNMHSYTNSSINFASFRENYNFHKFHENYNFREFRKNYNFRQTRKSRKFDLLKLASFAKHGSIFSSFVFHENPENTFVKNPNQTR